VRVLVVGSGGREHALTWALGRSEHVDEVHVAPGNGGTSTIATNVPIEAEDISGLVDYADREGMDLVVVGPELPLAHGLVDALQERGVRAFGPTRKAAMIEASKAFSKEFMRNAGIPTAEFAVFEDAEAALSYVEQHGAPVVVKASGLAGGKGAIVCHTEEEARNAIEMLMRARSLGTAGETVVIEEQLTGQEVTVLAFADGKTVVPMVAAQDHKAAYDGDHGPNTGGMGCYAPVDLVDDALLERIRREVLQPAVDGLAAVGAPYVGVLYAGLMVQGDDVHVLEFNCRFGDPEAQAVLPLLRTDLYEVTDACVDGRLDEVALSWSSDYCVCVVMASGGYPGRYETGYQIHGLDEVAEMEDVVVFHAGTERTDGGFRTAGGRVLGVTAWDVGLAEAVARAYSAVEVINWTGVCYRRDIGAKGLARERSRA